MKNNSILLALSICLVLFCGCQTPKNHQKDKVTLNFSNKVFGQTPSLYVYIKSVDMSSGKVTIGGGDKRKPTDPFVFEWGNGTITEGIFPQEYIYTDRTQNYTIKVKSRYPDMNSDSTEAFVRFITPELKPIPINSKIAVTISDHKIELGSRLPTEGMYSLSESLSYFTDDFFTVMPRKMVEYILSVAATIQKDLVNDNVYMNDSTFQQVLLRDAGFGGMYSLWYTNPVSFGVGDYGFQGSIQWSSFFHEMGHNFTLNTPTDYYFGGKTDGNANAIYSEAMAQIFQHVTDICIVNNYKNYGLSEDLAQEIRSSSLASFSWLSAAYQRYISSDKKFESWNDPATPQDETVETFMTIAYKFFEHAEKTQEDYANQLKRMMKFLQRFNQDWQQRFDPEHNSPEGAAFRATMMVSALSYAFNSDLRAEFKELNFPVNDDVYSELMACIK